jgi:hypothetical protein
LVLPPTNLFLPFFPLPPPPPLFPPSPSFPWHSGRRGDVSVHRHGAGRLRQLWHPRDCHVHAPPRPPQLPHRHAAGPTWHHGIIESPLSSNHHGCGPNDASLPISPVQYPKDMFFHKLNGNSEFPPELPATGDVISHLHHSVETNDGVRLTMLPVSSAQRERGKMKKSLS